MRITTIDLTLKSALFAVCAYLGFGAGLVGFSVARRRLAGRWLLKLCLCALPALGAAMQTQAQEKVDPAGTWTWTTPSPPAGQTGHPRSVPGLQRKTTLRLKLDGDKLTGTISTLS